MQDHAFNTCVEPVDSTPATGSLGHHSAEPFTWASACRIHAPIVFGIRVLTETLSQCDCARRKHGVRRWNIQPMAIGTPSGIARVFDGKWMRILAGGEPGCSWCNRDSCLRRWCAV